jgi:uncharacterized protein YxeA
MFAWFNELIEVISPPKSQNRNTITNMRILIVLILVISIGVAYLRNNNQQVSNPFKSMLIHTTQVNQTSNSRNKCIAETYSKWTID